eukprot:TRINITY_DN46934_c0_g1_i1.p1 TRINITY_DN46934_c0_g1~~TRINITY_DN46934_c0_g1_i1.p1  ORF type:complete len:326 (+),score=60.60 TRINITY_DN46934_c0_g1_i1:62-1039(+)
MARWTTFALAIAAAITTSGGASSRELNFEGFDEFVLTNDKVFVFFHAPWCSHCKGFWPQWKTLQNSISADIQLAEVDVTQEERLARRYSIGRLPTLKFFKHAAPKDYDGDRDAAAINGFLAAVARPSDELQQAAQRLLSQLPPSLPFRNLAAFTVADLYERHPHGTIALALSALLYSVVGVAGLLAGRTPRILCWLLNHVGISSLLCGFVALGKPIAGLLQPYYLCLLIAAAAIGMWHLVALAIKCGGGPLAVQTGAASLWALAGLVSPAALAIFYLACLACRHGETAAFLLFLIMWHVITAAQAGFLIYRCRQAVIASSRRKID